MHLQQIALREGPQILNFEGNSESLSYSSQNPILDLPSEVLIQIFKSIQQSSAVLSVSLTCRKFALIVSGDPAILLSKYFDFVTNPHLLGKVPEEVRDACWRSLFKPLELLSGDVKAFSFRAPNLFSGPFDTFLFNYRDGLRLLAPCNLFGDTVYSALYGSVEKFDINESSEFSVTIKMKTPWQRDFKPGSRSKFYDYKLDGFSSNGVWSCTNEGRDEVYKPLPIQLKELEFHLLDKFRHEEVWFKELGYVNCEPQLIVVTIKRGKLTNLHSSIFQKIDFAGVEHIRGAIKEYRGNCYTTTAGCTISRQDLDLQYQEMDEKAEFTFWV